MAAARARIKMLDGSEWVGTRMTLGGDPHRIHTLAPRANGPLRRVSTQEPGPDDTAERKAFLTPLKPMGGVSNQDRTEVLFPDAGSVEPVSVGVLSNI